MSIPLQIADFNDYLTIVLNDANKNRIRTLASDVEELKLIKREFKLDYLTEADKNCIIKKAQEEKLMEHMREMGEENL